MAKRLTVFLIIVGFLLTASTGFALERREVKPTGTPGTGKPPISGDIGKPKSSDNAVESLSEQEEIIDLRPMLKGKKLSEGLNIIHTTPSGLRVSAVVTGGKVVAYEVINRNGMKVTLQKKEKDKKREFCLKCWEDSNGKIVCKEIPCPTWDPDALLPL